MDILTIFNFNTGFNSFASFEIQKVCIVWQILKAWQVLEILRGLDGVKVLQVLHVLKCLQGFEDFAGVFIGFGRF